MSTTLELDDVEQRARDNERRRRRLELRRYLSQLLDEPVDDFNVDDDTKTVTSLPRVAKCGRYRINAGAGVGIGITAQGRAVPTNVQRCGSVWACPTCQAKIRQARADEIKQACATHLDVDVDKTIPERRNRKGELIEPARTYRAGALLFVTVTLPHDEGDALEPLWKACAKSWSLIWAGDGGIELRDDYGITGAIRALEVTHGANGWHPHLHVLLFLEAELDQADVDHLETELYDRWVAGVTSFGYRQPTRRNGIDVERVGSIDALGDYLTELAEGWSPNMELARLDLKAGRRGGRSPLELLASAYNAGDELALTPDVDQARRDLKLWREFEQASWRKNQLTWTPGLKRRFDVDELTDQELVDDDELASTLIELTIGEWLSLCRRAYAQARLFETLEAAGQDAAIKLLWRWGYQPTLYDSGGTTHVFPFAIV